MIVDVHAHLTSEDYNDDIDECLAQAEAVGIEKIIVVSMAPEETAPVLSLCGRYPNLLRPSLGIHPVGATLEACEKILEHIQEHKDQLVAVGEIGLDFSPRVLGTEDPEGVKEIQKEVLRRQTRLALELDLPLNVHSRSAGHHTISFLRDLGATNVLMHAFDGKPHYAEEAARHGFYFSVPPSIVRNPPTQKLVSRLPVESLLLETDAPALGPEKNVRNVPANILKSIELIAQLKNISKEEVIAITGANAKRLFRRL